MTQLGIRELYVRATAVAPEELPQSHRQNHTMAGALDAYVAQRVHADLLHRAARRGQRVRLLGIYPDHFEQLAPGATPRGSRPVLARTKRYNRVRPSYFEMPHEVTLPCGMVLGPDTVVIAVPPGRDYVVHIASLVRHYCVRVAGRRAIDLEVVRFPDAERAIAEWTGIGELIAPGDRVVLGYVDAVLGELRDRGWSVVGESHTPFYGSTRLAPSPGADAGVLLLGARFSYWGCISGRLARALREQRIDELVYVGKLGTLDRPTDIYRRVFVPSRYLVLRDDRPIEVESPPNGLLAQRPDLATGAHVSVGTVLEENFAMRAAVGAFDVRSIDNEISQIAQACSDPASSAPRRGLPFTALHFATDYIRRPDELTDAAYYDLATSRQSGALAGKDRMLRLVASTLSDYLSKEHL